jgi:PAS domain S-box-containing protein
MGNEQAETLFGYARGELVGQRLNVLLPESSHEIHTAHCERYFSAPRTRQMGAGLELSGKRRDGTEFPVDISLRPLLLDKELYVVGAVRDVTKQKRVEEIRMQLVQREQQAKESELEMTRLRSLFAQAPVIMNIFRGPEHIFEFIHPLGKELVGGRDLTGMKIREALPETVETGHLERLDRVYQTGETLIEMEMPALLREANGELVEHFFNSTCKPWYDIDGKIAGLLHVTVEVTEQVRARQQVEALAETLKQKRERLELAQEAGRIGTFEWNIRTNELSWTREEEALHRLLSGAFGEKLQQWTQVIHPDDFTGVQQALDRAIAEKSTLETTFRITWADQSIHWMYVRARTFYDEQGNPVRILGVSMDITQQKEVDERLKESEKRFRTLADAMPQMVWTAGPDGILDYCNQRWFDYTGMVSYEPTHGFRPALHSDDIQNCIEKWHQTLKTGEVFEIECRYRRGSDGAYRWHLARGLPVRDSNGTIIKWFGTSTDIDDQKRIEEALRLSEACLQDQAKELERTNSELRRQRDELILLNSALEEANRGRQFFSTMSHELRTPLASIIGFSQLLLGEVEQAHWNKQQQNSLERILKNGQHLLNLINDVLDLEKIEAGLMDVTFTQVDVREMLTWVIEETQSLAIVQKLGLTADVEDEVAYLESNPIKLRQILLNLVSNAIKYTEHGEVTISATRVGADRLAFAVKDTGIGIPENIQERIFEAFYQVDGSYTRKSGGTGLGLSIVSQLTALLGGKIELTSAPGQGSTFTVILPIRAISQQVEQDTPRLHPEMQRKIPTNTTSSPALTPDRSSEFLIGSAQPEATQGQRNLVLAVDDDQDVIALIKTSLQNTPYTVVGVQDPLKLIELVQEMHPCAITLDVIMPDLNGWQILHQLKSNPATSSVPVIMLTVLSEPATGYVLGADDYLIKPFQKEMLLNTLQRLMALPKDSPQANKPENSADVATLRIN